MSDFSALHMSPNPIGEPILARILAIRDRLLLLKQDRSTYIKSQDVFTIYDQLIEQVHKLEASQEEDGKSLEPNNVHPVLEDCFQLVSLFFLTIGKNNEAPAVYSMTSTIRRLLDHLKEAAFFSAKDLASASHALDKMQSALFRGKDVYSPYLLRLLDERISACRNILADLRETLADLSPALSPIHERLVSILRSISAANTRTKFRSAEVEDFRDQLKDIKASMIGGEFKSGDGSIPTGQRIVSELLERCLLWSDIVLSRQGKIDVRFKLTYDKLCDIRNHLEKLSLTQAWSLRETDLYKYQQDLDSFDESRINGNFEDLTGYRADLHAQRTLLYLIRRSYAYIYSLIISSEPVSEALLPVFNQLQTLRRCLIEVKRSGGVSSPRELYPYSMKLNSIDNMRVGGKFMVGQDVPEGQGSVNSLLEECFELSYQLRVESEHIDIS